MSNKLEKAISIIIKATVFLLPLFFLPWTFEFFEFNKQYLLWLVMPLALFLWLANQAAAGQLKIKTNPINFPVIIFLTLTFISSLFSLDRFSSFFGYYGCFTDAWLGTLSLAILFFLLINTGVADSAKKIMELLKLFIYSAAGVTIISSLVIFNVFATPVFNPAGDSFFSLAIFLSIAAVLAVGLLISQKFKKIQSIFLGFALIIFLLVLAKIIFGQNLFKVAVPDYKTAVSVSQAVIKNSPVLGSGPGTFARDYSLYRPVELNQRHDWQIRFDKSASQFLEMTATHGLPAILSYLLVIILIIYISVILLIKHFKDDKADENKNNYLIVNIFVIFILLFFAQLLFPADTVLIFSFWLFLGLLVSYWQPHNKILFKEKIINLNKTPLSFYAAKSALLIAAIGWLILAVFEIKFYAADIMAARQGNREKNLNSAISLNPYRANYSISLAEFYLNQARAEASKPAAEQNSSLIQSNISQALAAGKRAVAVAPDSVQAQETLGMIYRDIRPLTVGSELWAVKSFNRAYALEPSNPVLATELAKAYVNLNDQANAEKYFLEAIKLKTDYYDASFGLAKLYINENKGTEALKLLTKLALETADTDVYYELGRLYYNQKEVDKAIDTFELILNIYPNHSNSLYDLGIAYEAKGLSGKALKYYQKVLELNPGNEEIVNKIKELNK